MMKKTAAILLLISVFHTVLAIDIYEDISNALRSGDAKQVSTFFGNTLDLTIGDQEDVYSKAQAELILRDFFSKNTPKSFVVMHKGSSKEGTLYAIGTLVSTSGKSFRTSFYLKSNAGKYILQELRIEPQ
jgi:hypothetical protein